MPKDKDIELVTPHPPFRTTVGELRQLLAPDHYGVWISGRVNRWLTAQGLIFSTTSEAVAKAQRDAYVADLHSMDLTGIDIEVRPFK